MKMPIFTTALAVACIIAFFAMPQLASLAAQPNVRAIAIIVQPQSPAREISLALLRRIFSGEATEFGGTRAVPFNYGVDNSLRRAFDSACLAITPAQVGAYWIDRRIRGQGLPPRSVPSPEIMKAVIAKLSGAIGYVLADQVEASVRVLTIDGKNVKSADYPLMLR
jgi:hypothetical protein